MVRDDHEYLMEFAAAASTLNDLDLRGFAEDTLPTLQSHLSLAEALPGEQGRAQANAGPSTASI
jgi:hypothetical protein